MEKSFETASSREYAADSIERVVGLIVMGYAVLLGLAFYADGMIHKYKVRKRREKEAK